MTYIGQASAPVLDNPENVPATPSFKEVLLIGNETGGTPIIITEGDAIQFANSGFLSTLVTQALTGNIQLVLPSTAGTIALLSDIPVGENLQETLILGDQSNRSNLGATGIHNFQIPTTNIIHVNSTHTLNTSWQTSTNTILSEIFDNNTLDSSGSSIAPNNAGLFSFDFLFGTAVSFAVSRLTGIEARDDIFQKGIVYPNNYRPQYDDRTVPDWGNVKDLVTYTEQFGSTFANTINNNWQTVIIAGELNKRVDIAINAAGDRITGIRQVGSIQERKLQIKDNTSVLPVNTDSLGRIQIFSSDITKVLFRLVGSYKNQ